MGTIHGIGVSVPIRSYKKLDDAARLALKANVVPETRTVNSKALSADVTLTGEDIAVSAEDTRTIPEALEEATDTLNPPITSSGPLVTFTSEAAGNPVNPLLAHIEPVQDLNGYDHPWPGGAGKNLAPVTLEGIKASNTDKTWNGNSCTVYGVTFTVLTDSGGNVTGIRANGTSTAPENAYASLYIFYGKKMPAAGDYIFSTGFTGSSSSTYHAYYQIGSNGYNLTDNESTKTISASQNIDYRFVIERGVTANNVVLYPMIRLASETDDTFEPYSNICPITGWDGVNVTVSPATDVADGTSYAVTFPSDVGTVYGGTLDVTRGKLTVDTRYLTISSLSVSWQRIPQTSADAIVWSTNRSGILGSIYLPERGENLISDRFRYHSGGLSAGTKAPAYSMSIYDYTNNYFRITLPPDITSSNEVNTWFASNPTSICYKLHTPITYQLTPQQVTTILGTNNIFADCGDVEVTYRTGANPAVLTVQDIGVAGGAAAYNDVMDRLAALEAAVISLGGNI